MGENNGEAVECGVMWSDSRGEAPAPAQEGSKQKAREATERESPWDYR